MLFSLPLRLVDGPTCVVVLHNVLADRPHRHIALRTRTYIDTIRRGEPTHKKPPQIYTHHQHQQQRDQQRYLLHGFLRVLHVLLAAAAAATLRLRMRVQFMRTLECYMQIHRCNSNGAQHIGLLFDDLAVWPDRAHECTARLCPAMVAVFVCVCLYVCFGFGRRLATQPPLPPSKRSQQTTLACMLIYVRSGFRKPETQSTTSQIRLLAATHIHKKNGMAFHHLYNRRSLSTSFERCAQKLPRQYFRRKSVRV